MTHLYCRTADLEAAMRMQYRQPEWALFFNVADGTGATQRRWADAVAMSMYPSRGLSLVGFEFKVSRSDWQRERKHPEKAESVAQYCDTWYVVAPEGMIPRQELPEAWGLLEWKGDLKLWQKYRATQREKPKPLTRAFIASLLRSGSKADEAVIDAMVRKEVDKQRQHDNANNEAAILRRTQRASEVIALNSVLNDIIEKSSYGWSSPAQFAEAANLAHRLNLHGRWGGMKKLEEIHGKLGEVLELLGKLKISTGKEGE